MTGIPGEELLGELVLGEGTPAGAPEPPAPQHELSGFARGLCSTNNVRGKWDDTEEKAWIDRLSEFGIEWVTFQFPRYQATIASTTIDNDVAQSPLDSEMVAITAYAHAKGLKVCWKGALDLSADPGNWRGQIGEGFTEGNWTTWFANVTSWLVDWAVLAESSGVDMFMFLTEMDTMQTREAQCRALVAALRAVYSGVLTYCADRQYYRISGDDQEHWYSPTGYPMAWWDAVDYPACSAYFRVTTSAFNPSLAELAAGWVARKADLEAWATETGKSVILAEFGCCAATGASYSPWQFSWGAGLENQPEQADYYQAMFDAIGSEDWLIGLFLWDFSWWNTYGANDREFAPLGKVAGEVIGSRWGRYPETGWYA